MRRGRRTRAVRRSRQAHAGGARATRISRTETAVPESGFLAAARGAERGRGVQRESLPRTASGPIVQGVPTGSVITSDRQHVRLGNRFSKGELGSRSGFVDQLRVPRPTAVGSAAGPGRKLPAQENAPPSKSDAARREPSRRRWSSTGFRRVTPVLRGRSRGATFSTPRRAGRARISRAFVFQAIALSFDGDWLAVMHQPIDQSGGQGVVKSKVLPQSRKGRFVLTTVAPRS